MPVKPQANEIYLERVYDAPVKLVWDAWTDPKKAAKWWGPRGFTITTKSKDLRPDGHWEYTMHGPDGVDYPNRTKYFEVLPCAKLVYDHGANDHQPPLFRVTVTFHELKGNKTRMEMTMAFESPEKAKEIGKFIKIAGGNSTWDRLGEYLEHEDSGKDIFIINRSFETSIHTMFDLWTNAEHFAKWLPPTGFRMELSKSDLREGGSLAYSMTNGEIGFKGAIHYEKIQRPDCIVYTQVWPETMKITVRFTEEASERTRVSVLWEPQNATAAEIAEFVKERAGMTLGWTGSFDQLEELLKN
jgi:uncharacterized protein YndB with AHSA1/START domain